MPWDRCFSYSLAPLLGSRSEPLVVVVAGFASRVEGLACFVAGIVAELANVSALGYRCLFDNNLGWLGYGGGMKLG